MTFFELNKIAGALLATLAFAVGIGITSQILFTPEAPAKPGYEIAIEEAGATATKVAEPTIEELFATASVEKGATVAKKCGACHNFAEGAGAKVGPDLYGVVGRDVASVEGFAYSAAMKAKGGKWTPEAINAFITNPKSAVPGTAMGFAGLPKAVDRANIIAYLNSLSHNPQPLPTAAAAAPEAAPAK
ncbi:c-type cytochrome [Xanthobacter variabilis]|uniref:c-type cytochrome n=1 Tax=Xanthobacter variabilis TaxID=3119932 RepID=UPI003726CA7C